MSASRPPASRVLQELLRLWWGLPLWPRVGLAAGLAALLLVAGLFMLWGRSGGPPPAEPGTYVFCFYNVENLFDDQPDGRRGPGDKEIDPWMANDAEARERKLSRLCDVLLHDDLNGGRGPDILGLCEVESERAVELLQNALNARIKDPALHYSARAWAGPGASRHIGPALLARLPLKGAHLLGNHQRILEARVEAAGGPLTVIVSHWSSRVSDPAGKGAGRAKYAKVIYGRFRELYEANAAIPLLVCGDFNDDPTDPSVADHLNATGDIEAVRAARPPMLFNPFAGLYRDGKLTHAHGSSKHVFDQICLSPGLLGGGGWSYVEGSAAIVEQIAYRGKPDRFGGKSDKRPYAKRGASDHFPVTVKLRVTR